MSQQFLIGLAAIIIAGIGAQWLAWRFGLPSILLLLLFGFLLGPVFNLLNPDHLFGNLLFPIISLSVALILFEGGLSLKLSELPEVGWALLKLVSLGALVTWIIIAVAAYYLLHLHIFMALLFGALMIVTGPTVTGPMLHYIRPKARLNNLLKWEGIIIDPLGAMLAVLVFEIILSGNTDNISAIAVSSIITTILIGIVTGIGASIILTVMIRHYWVPDFLQNPLTLAAVVAAYVVANVFKAESGLLAVTVMGITLTNQSVISIKHIIEFKENLRVLLLSGLFIILAARLKLSDLTYFSLNTLLFLAVLIFLARPAAVFISTIGNKFNWREKLFISWLAPRGIVAAAVSSVLAIDLIAAKVSQAELLVPLTFIIIISTVVIYGLSSAPLARRLRISRANPQGVLIVGAHYWARLLGEALQNQGFKVLLADRNRSNIRAARLAGLPVFFGNILAHRALVEINLEGIGRLLALTANNEINSLAALHFSGIFGRTEVYQLAPHPRQQADKNIVSPDLRGRMLFSPRADYAYLAKRFAGGSLIKVSRLSEDFTFADWQEFYGRSALPLFLINEASGTLSIFTAAETPAPTAGQKIIGLVDSDKKNQSKR